MWQGITIQGLYCYLDMGINTVMYYKCSHVRNLVIVHEEVVALYLLYLQQGVFLITAYVCSISERDLET